MSERSAPATTGKGERRKDCVCDQDFAEAVVTQTGFTQNCLEVIDSPRWRLHDTLRMTDILRQHSHTEDHACPRCCQPRKRRAWEAMESAASPERSSRKKSLSSISEDVAAPMSHGSLEKVLLTEF